MKLSILILLLFCTLLIPQNIDNGQYPPGIKWKVIKTPSFRIVFPDEIIDEGQRVSNILEYIFPKISLKPLKKRKRITIFLSNSGIFSNAYIRLAPKKGEFYSTPPQSGFTGNTEWYWALALHEGKHIDQFEQFNSGFTRTVGVIFGEMGRSLFSTLSIPLWFWEGDAVHTETIFSSGGRGRLPSFSMGLRTLLLSGKRYKYLKSYLSSYRDYIPDIYRLGYFMATYMKNNFSTETYNKIFKHSSKYSFFPLIFSGALKKKTGSNIIRLYENVMEDLRLKWGRQEKKLKLSKFRKINKRKKYGWTQYTSPRVTTGDDIISQKYGLSNSLGLVRINPDGSEKKLIDIRTGSHILNSLSVEKNKIVWSEPVKDPRWGRRSYSEIILYDISRKDKRRVTRRSRYFSPALSPDSELIAAIRFSGSRETSIVILKTSDGSKVREYSSPENSFLQTPSWSPSGENIVMVRMYNGKKSISILNLNIGNFRDLIPLSYDSPSTPVFYKNYVLYSSPYSGIDNIYAVDINTGEKFKLTTSRFGAFFPEISRDKKRMIYCDYNIKGMDIVEAPLNRDNWIPSNMVDIDRVEYFKDDDNDWNNNNLTDMEKIPSRLYPVENYSTFKDQINFHSLVVLPNLPDPGIEIHSNNKLNTTFIKGGTRYNTNERTAKFYAEATYAGFFPKIKLGFSRAGRNSGSTYNLKWDETTTDLSISIPLDLSRGVFSRRLYMESKFSFTKISGSNENKGYKIEKGNINSVSYKLLFSNIKYSARRDLAPRSGQFFSTIFSHTPWDNHYKGERLFLQTGIYLPGIFRHDSIRVSLSYEKQKPENYIFSSYVPFSRGYEYTFYRKQLFSSIDYSFALGYPDLALGQLLYLKRLKGTVFFDFGKGYDGNNSEKYNSAGVEIKGDINLFSIPLDLEAGMRISYRLRNNSFFIEPLFFGISF